MSSSTVIIIVVASLGMLALVWGLFVALARLARREPYRSFLRLPTRSKLSLLKAVFHDPRVPWAAKALLPLTLLYLSLPLDLIPDFVPVLGYLDDMVVVLLALVLFIRLCPREVVREHLERVSSP
ncbi:MAG: DUF1232 domain-containing protein [Dehalococcoidia bacterium]